MYKVSSMRASQVAWVPIYLNFYPVALTFASICERIRARGIVCGHVGGRDMLHGRPELGIVTYLAGDWGLWVRISIANVGDLRVGESLEDVWRIGVETPLTGAGDFRAGAPFGNVWRIGAEPSLAGSLSGTQKSVSIFIALLEALHRLQA